jgi:hypothetical protein
MRFVFFDKTAVDEVINGRLYQSVEFEQAKTLISFLRGSIASFRLTPNCLALKQQDGAYVICPNTVTQDYVVFDMEGVSGLFFLDDGKLLLAIQKTLRFCKKLWAGLSTSKHERILSNGKAVVFPYPIGMQTSLRVVIDRNPDEKRRIKREAGQAYLVYKFSETEGVGPTESPTLTNFRRAAEYRANAYVAAKQILLADANGSADPAGALDVTALSNERRPHLYEAGLENWRKWLTTQQIRFIDTPLAVPHRIEGPAGTGKTLCLVLKAVRQLEASKVQQQTHRSLFVTHSDATKRTIENLFATNNGEAFLADEIELLTARQSVEVTTLHELCSKLLHREISTIELVDRDAYESKLTQKLYASEAVERAISIELSSHQPYLSESFLNYLQSTDRWAIAEMLQHEISVQIKGRAEQDLSKYKKLPSLRFGFPVQNDGDRTFAFLMYEEYQRELEAAAQFDTDDVVLSAMSQLGTPIWRRRRLREGYDSIFIDETHLFNLNELSIFHKLTRIEIQHPIAYSVDRSQALGDRGWTTEAFEDAFDPDKNSPGTNATDVKSVFRCSPEITDLAFSVTSSGATLFTNFHDPLRSAVSTFSAEEERKTKKPSYVTFAGDADMMRGAFLCADTMANEMGCQKADVAIIAFGDDLFRDILRFASDEHKPVEVIKSRGDFDAVSRARQGGRFVLSSPEFVGGLEFAGVILVGVDGGRVPPNSSGAGESQTFLNYSAHQKLYVSITRAKYRVEILGTRARGVSAALSSAISSELLEQYDFSK